MVPPYKSASRSDMVGMDVVGGERSRVVSRGIDSVALYGAELEN